MAARQLHVVGHLARVVHLMAVVETRPFTSGGTGAGHLLFSVGVGVLPGIDLPGGDLGAADHRGWAFLAEGGWCGAGSWPRAAISRTAAAATASGGSRRACVGCPGPSAVR